MGILCGYWLEVCQFLDALRPFFGMSAFWRLSFLLGVVVAAISNFPPHSSTGFHVNANKEQQPPGFIKRPSLVLTIRSLKISSLIAPAKVVLLLTPQFFAWVAVAERSPLLFPRYWRSSPRNIFSADPERLRKSWESISAWGSRANVPDSARPLLRRRERRAI